MRALKIVFNSINFCDLVLRLRLNADQSDTVNFVQKGHNVLITGQAGVGCLENDDLENDDLEFAKTTT